MRSAIAIAVVTAILANHCNGLRLTDKNGLKAKGDPGEAVEVKAEDDMTASASK